MLTCAEDFFNEPSCYTPFLRQIQEVRMACSFIRLHCKLTLMGFSNIYRASTPIFLAVLASICCNSAAINSIPLASSSFSISSQPIQSQNERFEFGLFTLPQGSSTNVYLGIRYSNLQPLTQVWIANRATPVSTQATFALSADGELALIDANKTVWTIGGSGQNVSTAVLLDTGNFVLRTANSTPVWQSFDHPGDTWLPTMTMGPGKRLLSWLSPTDPTPGLYSLEEGASREEFVMKWNSTRQYWTSGAWNGHIFSSVQEMTAGWIYNFTLNSSGFTWTIYPNVPAIFNISRFVMATSGQIEQSSYDPSNKVWNTYWFQPKASCDAVGLCGHYGICNGELQPPCNCPEGFEPVNKEQWQLQTQVALTGCKLKSALNCSAAYGSNDAFIPANQTAFDAQFAASTTGQTETQCLAACLRNCSCTAVYHEPVSGNCSLVMDQPLFNGQSTSSAAGTFFLRIALRDATKAVESGEGSGGRKVAMIAGIFGGAAALGAALGAILVIMGRRKTRRRLQKGKQLRDGALMVFTYEELRWVTDNFKEKIGSGAFGAVYKGTVREGGHELKVAVKKLQRQEGGEKQFKTEVKTIGTIQHLNLVRLLGFCSSGVHRLLVYEFMENGSLDALLFHPKDTSSVLTWPQRFSIATGAARALAYLHEGCRECIIHCDIKPENLLLDDKRNVKVSDFGLATLVGREFSRVLTTLRGTRGYLAPEWMSGIAITAKADVYSYGMTLLELISGHRNIDGGAEYSQQSFFPVLAAKLINGPHSGADLVSLLDPLLQGSVELNELQRALYCAIWCIQDNEDLRPSMAKVFQILDGTIPIQPPPIPSSLKYLVEGESLSFLSSSQPILST